MLLAPRHLDSPGLTLMSLKRADERQSSAASGTEGGGSGIGGNLVGHEVGFVDCPIGIQQAWPVGLDVIVGPYDLIARRNVLQILGIKYCRAARLALVDVD